MRAFLHTIPCDGGESISIPPTPPHEGTSLATATVPRRSIANRHVNRRLHMCANRKLHSSKLFERSGPSYTPYHMMAESRPLYLLLRLVRAPLRLQQRYHADPLLTGTSIVVYICVPIANYTAARCLNDRGPPTHHTIWWRRVDLYFASPGHPFDYSNGNTTMSRCKAFFFSSSTDVYQTHSVYGYIDSLYFSLHFHYSLYFTFFCWTVRVRIICCCCQKHCA